MTPTQGDRLESESGFDSWPTQRSLIGFRDRLRLQEYEIDALRDLIPKQIHTAMEARDESLKSLIEEQAKMLLRLTAALERIEATVQGLGAQNAQRTPAGKEMQVFRATARYRWRKPVLILFAVVAALEAAWFLYYRGTAG